MDATTTIPVDLAGVTAKVQALLAKAESTTFGPEAEALIAKAQELITRYSIDPGRLAEAERTGEKPVHVEVSTTEMTYADARSSLLNVIARANRCRVVRSKRTGTTVLHVFGFGSDVDATLGLFNALQVVASSELIAGRAKAEADFNASYRAQYSKFSPRSFARNFWIGFAIRIGERLKAAQKQAEAGVGHSTALVLVRREDAVNDAVRDAFPHTTASRGRITNGTGYYAGHAAGGRASLSASLGGSRGALTR